jgi:hypothetical protein
MGLLSDLRATSKAAKALSGDRQPAAQQLRQGISMMRQMTEALQAQANTAADNEAMVGAPATVLRLSPTGAEINHLPVVRIELLVAIPGQPPVPTVLTCPLHLTDLVQLQPGQVMTVLVDPTNPSRVRLPNANQPGQP